MQLDNMRLRETHQVSGYKAKISRGTSIPACLSDLYLCAEIPHGHADDGGECLGYREYFTQLGCRNTF